MAKPAINTSFDLPAVPIYISIYIGWPYLLRMMFSPDRFHARLRGGETCEVMRLVGSATLAPWEFMGWRKWTGYSHGDTHTLARGDPELWNSEGKWREDGKPHRFDIVRMEPLVGEMA